MKPSYAPKELSSLISNNLIGKPYVDEKNPAQPLCDPSIGFNCWGLTRYLYELTGNKLPVDAFEARKYFREVDEPEYRCIIVFKPKGILDLSHAGFLETYRIVVHSSREFGGVVRTYLDSFVAPYKLYKLR